MQLFLGFSKMDSDFMFDEDEDELVDEELEDDVEAS